MIILALNQGSSSVKVALFEAREGAARERNDLLLLGKVSLDRAEPREAESALRRALAELGSPAIDAIGHRIVHGGSQFVEPLRLTADRLDALTALSELAPLHNRSSLEGIEIVRKVFGSDIPMVAVFDTAFHAGMPERARRYAIPESLAEKDQIRRFGFHGLSYESIVNSLGNATSADAARRVVALHLGSGCSAAAILDGQSIDTTMGLTPLEGLMMGTRSGDVDPALIGHLSRTSGAPVETIEEILNRRSGLLGVSGLSADVRVLLEQEREHPSARLALEMFCYRARKAIGAYVAALGGIDVLVFTGGIGEHQPVIRERICAGLEALGIHLDLERNRAATGGAADIGRESETIDVRVIPAEEERMIAEATFDVVSSAA